MSEQLFEKITSRGYWEIQIRPATFNAQLIPYQQLESIITESRVRLRGWDFPHQWREGLQRGQDWIQGAGEWMNYLEQWRFHQSGLFIYYAAQHLDWLELATHLGPFIQQFGSLQPEQGIGMIETLHRFIDLYEFGARLALRSEFGAAGQMHIDVTIARVADRFLVFEDARLGSVSPTARITMQNYEVNHTYLRQVLIADTRDLALAAAKEFFARFEFNPSLAMLRGIAETK